MSTYEPGVVAVATVRGVKGVRVMRCGSGDGRRRGFWWSPEYLGDASGNEPQWRVHEDSQVTDIRPLVVLDLDDYAAKELASWLDGTDAHMSIGDRLRVAREIRHQTKPPRIPEPGLWGVVEAARREHDGSSALAVGKWIHVDALVCPWSHTSGKYTAEWSDLIDPTLIRGGLS